MPSTIVLHNVRDFDAWKSAFDSMSSQRKQFGCKTEHVYRGDGNRNEVLVLLNWNSLDQARQYSQSQEMREGMQKAGVMEPPTIHFID